jgi:hypothetical protein
MKQYRRVGDLASKAKRGMGSTQPTSPKPAMTANLPRPPALVILPMEHGSAMKGDRVVLRHLATFLEQRYDCQSLRLTRLGGIGKSLNVLTHLLPLELAPYWREQYRKQVRAIVADGDFAHVFILHEGLFYLAAEIDRNRTPVTLFAHNIISRFAIDSPLQPVMTALARRYERRWYAQPGARTVFISRSDRDEAVRMNLAAADAPVAPPGAPPAAALDPQAVFTGEAVITGTYEWWRKRLDLKTFNGTGLDLTAFDERVAKVAPHARILPSADGFDWGQAIRVGIITDQFAAGFKLKSVEYVAQNCLVFSRARLFEEFEGLPHAKDFIVDDIDPSAWPARIAALRAEDQADLRRRFLAFQKSCLKRYDWATCLEPLAPDIEAH